MLVQYLISILCVFVNSVVFTDFSLGKKRVNIKDMFFLHCLEEIVYYFHQYVSPQTKEIYCHSILRIWLLFCESRVWSQGFVLVKQVLYYLSHTSSPFCSGYFRDGVLRAICVGWPWTVILPSSASQVQNLTS
jgi:hypothetical protein